MGHLVSDEGLAPLHKNIKAILDFPEPNTVKQVHRFLGMVNFYRKFIPGCSVVARPLSQLLKSKKSSWTTECQKSFEHLKHVLTTPPILAYPDFSYTNF